MPRYAGYRIHRGKGKLYILQTRNGKRAKPRSVAVDMVNEGDKHEALLRVDAEQINQLLHRQIDSSFRFSPLPAAAIRA